MSCFHLFFQKALKGNDPSLVFYYFLFNLLTPKYYVSKHFWEKTSSFFEIITQRGVNRMLRTVFFVKQCRYAFSSLTIAICMYSSHTPLPWRLLGGWGSPSSKYVWTTKTQNNKSPKLKNSRRYQVNAHKKLWFYQIRDFKSWKTNSAHRR